MAKKKKKKKKKKNNAQPTGGHFAQWITMNWKNLREGNPNNNHIKFRRNPWAGFDEKFFKAIFSLPLQPEFCIV